MTALRSPALVILWPLHGVGCWLPLVTIGRRDPPNRRFSACGNAPQRRVLRSFFIAFKKECLYCCPEIVGIPATCSSQRGARPAERKSHDAKDSTVVALIPRLLKPHSHFQPGRNAIPPPAQNGDVLRLAGRVYSRLRKAGFWPGARPGFFHDLVIAPLPREYCPLFIGCRIVLGLQRLLGGFGQRRRITLFGGA